MVSKTIPWLLALAVIDVVIPVPITGILVIYALIRKPPWFRTLCAEIIAEPTTPPTPPPS